MHSAKQMSLVNESTTLIQDIKSDHSHRSSGLKNHIQSLTT